MSASLRSATSGAMIALARAPRLEVRQLLVDRRRHIARRGWASRPGSGRGRRGTSCSAAASVAPCPIDAALAPASICGVTSTLRGRMVGLYDRFARRCKAEPVRPRCKSHPRCRGTARPVVPAAATQNPTMPPTIATTAVDPDAGGEPTGRARWRSTLAVHGAGSNHDCRNRGAGRRQKMRDRQAVIHDGQPDHQA